MAVSMKKMKKESSPEQKKSHTRVISLRPTALVLTTYILLLLSKLIDITLVNRENEYYSVVILQLMIFLLPAAVWILLSGEGYVQRLRPRLPKVSTVLLILSAALLMSTGGLLLSVLFGGTESLGQSFSLYDTFISKDNGTVSNTIYLVMAYAVLPAICEELIYRGILCHEYERGGVMRAVLLSALFFAMLHFNLAHLPIYLFSGVILALTYYATRSLIGSMIAHFLYNIFGLFGQPYMNNLYHITGSMSFFLFLIVAVALISAALFCGEAARLYRGYLYRAESADYRKPVLTEPTQIRQSYLDVLRHPSALACFAVYIVALILSWL